MVDETVGQRVGHRIRRKREIVGKSQREVAEAIGIGRSQYSRLEKGDYQSLRFEQLYKLADVLLTSVDYLLLRSDDMGEIPPDVCPGAELSFAGETPLPAIVP
jgi:transcriptional regulator with XRE-family HTH domain